MKRERGWQGEKLVLLYSGNLGLGHCFTDFLQASLDPMGPLWAFAGQGKRRPELEAFLAQHPQARLQLLPYAAPSRLAASLASADILLASLEPGWEGLLVPSKIQGMFAAGKPVLFAGPLQSEPAQWIHQARAGWVVEPGDRPGLARALKQTRSSRERALRGANALRFARKHFDARINLAKICAMIESPFEANHGRK